MEMDMDDDDDDDEDEDVDVDEFSLALFINIFNFKTKIYKPKKFFFSSISSKTKSTLSSPTTFYFDFQLTYYLHIA